MKRILLSVAIILFALHSFSQTTGDLRSRQDGAWNDFNTWQRYDGAGWVNAVSGQIPDGTINVTIQNPNTVTINQSLFQSNNLSINGILQYNTGNTFTANGNVTIGTTGLFRVSQTPVANNDPILHIYGNLIVNGQLDGYYTDGTYESRLLVDFIGASNTTLTGTSTLCEIYEITVNKGTDITYEVDVQRAITLTAANSSNTRKINITNGTFKLSSASNISPYYGDQTICAASGRLWINHASAVVSILNSGNAYISGNLRIDLGTFNVGNILRIVQDSPGLSQINGGTINCTGNLELQETFTISGGTINVGASIYVNTNVNVAVGHLIVNAGTINIGDGNDALRTYGRGIIQIYGGTLNIYGRLLLDNYSNEFTFTSGNINIDPQHTVNLANSHEITYFADSTTVNFTGGTLTIVDPQLDKNSLDGFQWDAIDIEGTIGTKNFIGSTIRFGDGVSSSPGNSEYPGFSIYIESLTPIRLGDIIINNPSGMYRQVRCRTNTQVYVNNLTIVSPNDKYEFYGRPLNVRGNLINNGTMDGMLGVSNLLFAGTAAQSYSGTGTVVNLNRINFNNSSTTGVTLNSPIGANNITFSDGYIYTTSTNILTVYGTLPTNITGGTANSYVKGPFRRSIPSDALVAQYNFPVGKNNFRMLELFGLSTSGSGSGFITAEVFEGVNMDGHPAAAGLSTPTVAEQIYWQMSNELGTVNIDAASSVRLSYADPGTTPDRAIGQSNGASMGTFYGIGRNPGTGTLQSETFNMADISPTSNEYFIVTEIIPPLNGTFTVGTGGNYLNLTEVAEELRNIYIGGNLNFELLSTYNASTETIPVIFDRTMLTQNSYHVTIRPQSGVTGTILQREGVSDNQALIILDNVKNIIFDGRPGGSGSTDWTISNSRPSNPGPVFEFRNGTEENTLQYLNLRSNTQDSLSGVVFFNTTNIASGNDNNTIRYCDITGRTITYLIGINSIGTEAYPNTGNIIDNCNIYNFFSATENPKGINIGAGNTTWTISNNRLYQTSGRTFAEPQFYVPIQISTSTGDGFIINSNTIGYASSAATGSTAVSGSTSRFAGIWINSGITNASTITDNTISNISFTTNYNLNNQCGVFSGIFVENGRVNIGSLGHANIIGSTTSADNILIHYPSGGYSHGIKTLSTDIVNANYNQIGGFTITGASNPNQYFYGIWLDANNADITYNTIGSSSIANNIKVGTIGSTGRTYNYGIYNTASGTVTISNNTIANHVSYGRGDQGILNGILSDDGIATINFNSINNLNTYSVRNNALGDPGICGIRKVSTDAGQIVNRNTIQSLNCLNTAGIGSIVGISITSNTGAMDIVSQNLVHSLGTYSANSILTGIHLQTGTASIQNNMIRLGIDYNGASITQSTNIYGIQSRTASPANLYFNSVYIGGENVIGAINTYAFYNQEEQIANITNNIFVNARSNSTGTGLHHAIRLRYRINTICDYNIYYTPGAGGILSNIESSLSTTLRSQRAFFNGQDLHSGVGNPNFNNPTGNASAVNLHLASNTPAYQTGMITDGIVVDYDNNARTGGNGAPTNIGADNGSYTMTNAQDIFTPCFSFEPMSNKTPIHEASFYVTITDQSPSGQGIDLANPPRMYYRIGTSSNADSVETWAQSHYEIGALQSGNGKNGVWRFTILAGNPGDDYVRLLDGDIIDYFFVAQDLATTSNIWYSQFDATTPVFTNVATASSWPSTSVPIDFYGIGGHLSGTYTIGKTSSNFQTLTGTRGFFQNLSALNVTGNIIAKIDTSITEPGIYPCNQWTETGIGNYTVTIKPSDAIVKIIGNAASIGSDMIRINGADRLSIDGNYNGTGRYLQFQNGATAFSTFTFLTGANNDTIKNCNILGSTTSPSNGIIKFSESSTGNNSIVISDNIIRGVAANHTNNIYSNGTPTGPNSNNKILNNEIKNFTRQGIWVTPTGNGNGWTISDNTLYYDRADSVSGAQFAIRLEAGYGHTINGNSIGIPTDQWKNWSQSDFTGIHLSLPNIAPATNVTNNRICNILKSSSGTNPNDFRGIYVTSGRVNVTGNTIEDITNNGADFTYPIYISSYPGTISNNTIRNITTAGVGDFIGIYASLSAPSVAAQMQNNTINGININNTNAAVDFYGLYVNNGNTNITGNIIGGPNPEDKINFTGGGTMNPFYIWGDDFNQSLSNNQISNIETTSNTNFYGYNIADASDDATMTIANNSIDNLILNSSGNAVCFNIANGIANMTNNTIGVNSSIINSGAAPLQGIWVTTDGNNSVISGNTLTNLDAASSIYGINVSLTDLADVCQVNNNIISGINSDNSNIFSGILVTNGTNSPINGNTINNISLSNTSSIFRGIWVSSGSALIGTTSANLIGHGTIANSIQAAGPDVSGISVTNTGQIRTGGNTIANITQTNTAVSASIKGVDINGNGKSSVIANTIHHLLTSSTKSDISDGKLASQAIWVSGDSANLVTRNSITYISANGSVGVGVAGITESAPMTVISANRIYNLTNTSPQGTINGIVLTSLDSGNISNNMISLIGNDDLEYRGIWVPNNNPSRKKIYFNSVYIGGTAIGGNSYALLRGNNSTPLRLRNNILSNYRNGGSGKHYAIASQNISDWTNEFVNSNDYFSASASTIGLWGSTDNNFATWISNTGENVLMLSTDLQPRFNSPATCNLHINTANSCDLNNSGEYIAEVPQDYDRQVRLPRPDIGADEFNPTGGVANETWRGYLDSNWDSAYNWQCGQVPLATTNVEIPLSDHQPIITRTLPAPTVTVNTLTIYEGGILSVAPANSLTVTGTTILNGSLVLQSPANDGNIGSFIDNGTILGSGTVQVQRYLIGARYHYVTSPIQAGGNATSALFTATVPGRFNRNFYRYNETIDVDGNDQTSPSPYNSSYFGNAWLMAHNGQGQPAVNMTVGQGYATFDNINRNITFIGRSNTGNIALGGLSYTNNDPQTGSPIAPNYYDGWNLVGNPYPSTLDWDAVRANVNNLNHVDDGIYVWDNGQYSGYINGASVMGGTQDNRIAPMQAFFVHANANGASVNVSNSHRTHNLPNYFKAMAYQPNMIKIKVSTNGYDDYTAVRFNEESTEEYDGNSDLFRMYSSTATVPHLYSITNGNKVALAMNTMPWDMIRNSTIPLGFKMTNPGKVTISLEEFYGFGDGLVYFIDKQNNKLIDLREFVTYEFDFAGGTLDDRFELKFYRNTAPDLMNPIGNQQTLTGDVYLFALPSETFVDIDPNDQITYSATLSDGSPLPQWLVFNPATATFTGIPTDVEDINILITVNDLDGATKTDEYTLSITSLTDIESIENDSFTIFPNPSTGLFSIQFNNGDISANQTVSIKDINGKEVYNRKINNTKEEFNLTGFAPGNYIIECKLRNKVVIKPIVIIKN